MAEKENNHCISCVLIRVTSYFPVVYCLVSNLIAMNIKLYMCLNIVTQPSIWAIYWQTGWVKGTLYFHNV